MRRKDREITDQTELMSLLKACKVCRLGMVDEDRPYVLPMNFGAELEGGTITVYAHCAKEGRKLDVLAKNSRICFEVDCEHRLIEGEKACQYGYGFAGVLGEGRAELLTETAEKAHGLAVLMKHQTGKNFTFGEAETNSVAVLRIRLESVTGKRH